MRTTPAQRRAARQYHKRRKEAKSPRSEDLQRALVQSLRETWPHHIKSNDAMALLKDVLREARRRLTRRGFDLQSGWPRLKAILRSSTLVINSDGTVTDGAAEAAAHGIAVSERRR